MKNKIILNGLMAIAIVGVIWLVRGPLGATWAWFSDRQAVTDSMQRAGIWGPAILFALFVLQVFLAFIPGQALMVACGYLYGFWGGFLLSWLSLVIGGEAAYVLARKYGRPFAERWVSSDVLSRWDHAAAGQGIAFFAITLVMPLVPNDAMCYVAGLGTIAHRRFIAANLLGRGMACVITSAAGAWGGNLSWQVWAILIVIFVLIGLVYYWSTSKGTRLLLT
jgi:uncharacterized membrane protein YdjX (TVP38/TMEM64 family)